MSEQMCIMCGKGFEISEADRAFYMKIDVPSPKACPRDRLRRRLAFRNERSLYKRKCDKTGQDIISNLRPDAPVPVYSLPSFDFSKSFFEQLSILWRVAPRMHKASAGNEVNSEFTNHSGNAKNCYYTFNSEYNEDSMYLRFADHCRDCMDCNNIYYKFIKKH